MQEFDGIIVKARANIDLLSSECGGRRSGISIGYRPMIGIWGNIYEGAIDEMDRELVDPGGSSSIEMRILFSSGKKIIGNISRGVHFDIQEGTHIIGSGIIIEILEIKGVKDRT